MKFVKADEDASLPGSVVTVGSFDGVHRGHRKLLDALRRTGTRAGLETAVVTFDPIPRAVISPEICAAAYLQPGDAAKLAEIDRPCRLLLRIAL